MAARYHLQVLSSLMTSCATCSMDHVVAELFEGKLEVPVDERQVVRLLARNAFAARTAPPPTGRHRGDPCRWHTTPAGQRQGPAGRLMHRRGGPAAAPGAPRRRAPAHDGEDPRRSLRRRRRRSCRSRRTGRRTARRLQHADGGFTTSVSVTSAGRRVADVLRHLRAARHSRRVEQHRAQAGRERLARRRLGVEDEASPGMESPSLRTAQRSACAPRHRRRLGGAPREEPLQPGRSLQLPQVPLHCVDLLRHGRVLLRRRDAGRAPHRPGH